jgi:lipopolysaccharide transport system permease protein
VAPTEEAAVSRSVTEIRPSAGWFPGFNARELWAYRELGAFLALRDLKLRYKQTFFGVAWAVLQPLAAVAVFTLVFSEVAGLPSDGLPYTVFALSGLIVWSYVATGADGAARSLVEDRSLVERVYFPRLLAPFAAVLPGLLDLAISMALLAVFMAVTGVAPGLGLVLLPLALLAAVVVSLGAGLWLCALNVQYRDVRHALTFLFQLWFFASPVVVASSVVDGAWRYVYALNPMVGVIDLFRWSAVGAPAPDPSAALSAVAALVLLFSSALYFRNVERRFADVI